MDIQVKRGLIQDHMADTLIVNLFEGVTAPGGATGYGMRLLVGCLRHWSNG